MNRKSRFIASVIATAKSTEAPLPWARGSRTPRGGKARRRSQRA